MTIATFVTGSDFSDANTVMTYMHLSVASGSGSGAQADAATFTPPAGWEVVLSTDDGLFSPAPGGFDLFDTSNSVPSFQATAFRNTLTGEVVVAYRGTDETGELETTSIPLGAGIAESESPGIVTESYLQIAYDFYRQAFLDHADGDKSLVSFTGTSLGGIVAGVMGALTHLPALTIATGPHNLALEDLGPLLALAPEDSVLTPDDSGIFNIRHSGEVLNDAVVLVQELVSIAAVLSDLGLLSAQDAATISALDARFGDGERIGTNLDELDAGEEFRASLLDGIVAGDISDSILLHFGTMHMFTHYATQVLGYSAYQGVDGFGPSLYDAALFAGSGEIFSSNLADLVQSVLSTHDDRLTPLLTDAEAALADIQTVDFGLALIDMDGASIVPMGLGRILIEHAYQQGATDSAYGVVVSNPADGWQAFDLNAIDVALPELDGLTEILTALLPGDLTSLVRGVDTVTVQSSATSTEALATGMGADLILSGAGAQQINTGDGADIVTAGAGADTVATGAGNDLIIADADGDNLDGGLGTDWALYTHSDTGVQIDLAGGTGFGGYAEGDSLSGIENIAGSAFDDEITGNSGVNVLLGGAGRDTLFGGAGADAFVFFESSDVDIIGDFTGGGEDQILISSALAVNFDALMSFGEEVDGGVVFDFDGGQVLALAGLTFVELGSLDFNFI